MIDRIERLEVVVFELAIAVEQSIKDIKLLNSKVEDIIGVVPHPSTHYILDENGFILADEGGIRLTGDNMIKGRRIIRDSKNVSENYIDIELNINEIEYSFRVHTSDTSAENALTLISGVI